MSTQDSQVPVVGGGNKFELLSQLADIGRSVGSRTPFPLTVTAPVYAGVVPPKRFTYDVRVYINGLQTEDILGNAWIISGFIPPEDVEGAKWLPKTYGSIRTFRGNFNTRTRRGFIELRYFKQ
jgi:hypothetical protein